MHIKLLQLNMWAGTHFPAIEKFLREHDFDILCFQEVAGKDTLCGNVHATIDCYDELQRVLGETHSSQQLKTDIFTSNPQTSYQGTAIFYRKDFQLLQTSPVILHQHQGLYPSTAKTFEDMTRGFLDVQLKNDSVSFHVLTAHLAWATTKEEQPHQKEQNKKLIDYVSRLTHPWILTGDFNISPEQPSVVELEKYGKDLTKEYGIQNTIDPVYHRAWERIKPGFAIDYIFVSPDVKVEKFEVLENVHMSDHLGLTAELEVR